MSTDVAKFDPATYVEKVRDKIKQSLIDVIPDEQWNTMLKSEISSFFEKKTERNQFSGSTTTTESEFHRIVLKVLEEETKRRVLEMLNGPDWTGHWDGNGRHAGEEVARLARENGHLILAKWLESAIAQVVDSLRFHK